MHLRPALISERRSRRWSALWSASAIALSQTAIASSPTYVGPNGGLFSIANDWSTHAAPASGDAVYVGVSETTSTQTVYFNYTAANYTSGGFSILTVDSPDFTQNITVSENPGIGLSYSLQASQMLLGDINNGRFIQAGTSSSNNNVGNLTLGVTQDSSGEYDLNTNGSLATTGLTLGYEGLGTFRQNTGTVSVSSYLVLANETYGYGDYEMAGGTLNVSEIDSSVGWKNSDVGGVFNQTGGAVNADKLILYGNSSYTLNNSAGPSTLAIGAGGGSNGEYIGEYGTSTQTATFTQTNSTHTVTGGLYVGYEDPGTSTFTLNSGTISADAEYVGYNSAGLADFVQSGGTNTVTGDLGISDGAMNGEYDISSTGTLSIAGVLGLGGHILDGGSATFRQTGGSVSASSVEFGYYYGGGQYLISGGSLQTDSLNFSPAGDSQGTFTQTGGTVTVGSASTSGSIVMNAIPVWSSSYVMDSSDGPSTLTLYGNLDIAGIGGTTDTRNSFSQSGGTATINGNIFLGDTMTSQGNTISFSGSASCTVTGGVYIGGSATAAIGQGTLTVNGGSLTVDGTLQLWNTRGTTATLSAGTLSVGMLGTYSNPSQLTWTGGTLHLTHQPLYFDTDTTNTGAGLGNSLVLGPSQTLIVDNGNFEWLYGNNSTVTQNGGTNINNGLYVGGDIAGSNNTYTLNSGTLTVNGGGTEEIGVGAGNAAFLQFGGIHTAQKLLIGVNNNTSGLFDLYGGTLNVANLTLGYSVPGGSLSMTAGILAATSTANNGSIQQTGGVSALGAVAGTGAVQVGTISGSAKMTVASISQSTAIVTSNGVLAISPSSPAVNSLGSLTILGTGKLDLNNNHLFVNYGSGFDPISVIASYISSGYAGGTWNGSGIMSTMAQSNSASYGIGYADSADPGNPAGLASGQIEIKYTLLGDANLDGNVNSIDFAILASNFNKSVAGWDRADFNYDGAVNSIDFADLAANFNKGASQSSDVSALDAFASLNGLLADVPEPAAFSIAAAGAIAMLLRRRRAMIRN